nr:transposase [uncultured Flavobacterium sp.]
MPTDEQAKSLLQTLKEANKACNLISDIAWEQKAFQQFKLHNASYHTIKSATDLSSQVIVRCISKVADAYKLDKKTQRTFKPIGSISYDSRILTYKPNNIVSIWSIGGRIKMPFVCHNRNYLPYIKGEADLIFRKGKFYLFQTVDIIEDDVKDVEEFIGCDFGQADVCTLSDGTNYNSEQLKKVRKKYSKVRASVQAKGTQSSRRLLKRLSGRERRFVSINNHTIAKQIVEKAVRENKGIAIEDLSNIRKTAKPKSKALKTELNRWSFYQLRQFLTYKAKLKGVKLYAIPPAYTSQTCADCLHIGERKGKRFSCKNCGNVADADYNAARNIATWGCVVNQPEISDMFSCALHYSDLKPTPSL